MAVGIGLSALEANYANNQRQNAQDASNANQAIAGQLEQQQLQEGNQLFNRYTNVFQPAQDRLVAAAEQPLNPNVEAGKAIAGVQQASDNQMGIARRNLARYGINPNSGTWQDMERQNALGTAANEAGAATGARRWAQDETIRRLSLVSNMGNDALGMGLGLQRQGTNYYGNMADQYGKVAGGYGMAVGDAVGNGMYYANKLYPSQQPGTQQPNAGGP